METAGIRHSQAQRAGWDTPASAYDGLDTSVSYKGEAKGELTGQRLTRFSKVKLNSRSQLVPAVLRALCVNDWLHGRKGKKQTLNLGGPPL